MLGDLNPEGRVSNPADAWIRTLPPASAAPDQLVCFPHAGGAASYYGPMAKALGPDVAVLAIQYPGRLDRYHEPPIGSIEEIADQVADALASHLDRPTSLYGHSMGAAVAFEVALRLQAGGHGLGALFVSGRGAPSANRNNGVHQLDDDGLARELIRLGATDPVILADRELLEIVLPTIRADYRAIETYHHRDGVLIDCPIVVLTGSDDPEVDLAQAGAWRQHARGDFELHELPGGHFFLDEQRDRVLEIVRTRLARPPRAPDGRPA
jgi:surfactin synthase thioesterase subunit